MPQKNQVYLLLGSNLDPREVFIDKAISLTGERVGQVTGMSGIYQSEAWGFQSDTRFLNRVIRIETDCTPAELLQKTQQIEAELGRTRDQGDGYASRTIDIDILYYNLDVIDSGYLIIPHPRLHLRRFTLLPLAELAPELKHPVMHLTQMELLAQCFDTVEVQPYQMNRDEV